MGWSKAGLGKLSKLRVYNINGGKLTGEKIKEQSKESYSEYADRFISDQIQKAEDWSIFEKENVIVNTDALEHSARSFRADLPLV